MTPLLNVQALEKAFGGNRVLQGVSLSILPGEVVGLLGPNGSGKSTLLNAVSGFEAVDSGRVTFFDRDVTRVRSDQIVSYGLARTFQLPAMPKKMSTLEVVMAADTHRHGLLATVMRDRATRDREAQSRARALALIEELLLVPVKDISASSLSGGQKKLLSIACALMGQPRLLMLDEPTAGVHPGLRNDIVRTLKRLQSQGLTQLIVEHDMNFVREVCTRCIVLDRGVLVADCSPDELSSHPHVVEAYLGKPVVQPVKSMGAA